jgi:hypothetical protein
MRCSVASFQNGMSWQQVGGTDMQPGQAVARRRRLVPVESMQLLYQYRLLEPQGLASSAENTSCVSGMAPGWGMDESA